MSEWTDVGLWAQQLNMGIQILFRTIDVKKNKILILQKIVAENSSFWYELCPKMIDISCCRLWFTATIKSNKNTLLSKKRQDED